MVRLARLRIVLGLTLAAIVIVFLLPRIPQSQAYHNFADHRPLFGIPNCLNVISNFPFLVFGTLGLFFLLRQGRSKARTHFIESRERWPYVVFFIGIALTSFGSAYYHLAPGNERLVWDRLPMTVAFMSFLAATVAERISVRTGLQMLVPLLAIGAGSVLYWHLSELRGTGDLRPYIIVQFYPLVAIPLLILLWPARYTRSADLVPVLGLYAVAKLVELLDVSIFGLGRIVSGHTLKHLAAAAATYWLLRMLSLRSPAEIEPLRDRGANGHGDAQRHG